MMNRLMGWRRQSNTPQQAWKKTVDAEIKLKLNVTLRVNLPGSPVEERLHLFNGWH